MTISWGTDATIPNPSQYPITYLEIGATHLVATGALIHDIIAEKRQITLVWRGISTADKDKVVAKATTFASASLVLSNVGGPTVSVIPQPGSLVTDAFGYTPAWNVSVTVREV